MFSKKIPVFFVMVLLVVSFVYGVATHKYRLFPFGILSALHSTLDEPIVWSIGVYAGSSPFKLYDPDKIENPVLTANDVTDRNAKFVADPFLVLKGSKYFIFLEVLDNDSLQGDIAVAESADGIVWEYLSIVLDEPFHLSFPYVFEWNNEHYMIPESHEDLSIRLYKAISFPTEWQYLGNLLNGYHFVDSSILNYEGTWWMFVGGLENDSLNLYYADEIIGPWMQHPSSPIIRNNKHHARSAGRILKYNGRLIRLAQDDDPIYGKQVYAFEIEHITKTHYVERLLTEGAILMPGKSNWNSHAMHTLNAIEVEEGEWLAVVDGQ